jgi:hypothetical protein
VRWLQLTEDEAEHLRDVLDTYTEGFEDAREAIIQDRTISDVETALDLVSGIDEDFDRTVRIRERLAS